MATDFLLETTLKERSPELHSRFTNTVFAVQKILERYRLLFPEFTDHTVLHSINVVEFCNTLLGEEQIRRLNEDEIFVLLMACYLHDVGMGITEKDYEIFRREIDMESYLANHPDPQRSDIVRDFHHEFSGLFLRKYAALFDLPSEVHLEALVQVCRGHRVVDLFDEEEYPAHIDLPNGKSLCLPFLAALIRLADEIDVTASRNPKMLYDIEAMQEELQIWHAKMHEAARELIITPDAFTLLVQTKEAFIMEMLRNMQRKMQLTLDYCRAVASERSPYRITQETVDMKTLV